jgi:predicted RNA-binding protein with EMAP domain
MNKALFNIQPNFLDEDYNFWEDNRHLVYMKPYSKLYDRDESNEHKFSSKEMVMIFLLSDPNPELNKFYRMSYKERLEMLKETYFEDFDEEDNIIVQCLESYEILSLSPVELALKQEIDSMIDRARVFRNTPYTLDRTEIDNNGRALTIKGTATQLDQMRAKTPKLMENYDKIEAKYIQEKTQARLRGGRKRSKAEEKLL